MGALVPVRGIWFAVVLGFLETFAFPNALRPQKATAKPLPAIVQKDGRFALMVDGKPYLMLGMQANNSSAWPAALPSRGASS